jgi:hypothetical protein
MSSVVDIKTKKVIEIKNELSLPEEIDVSLAIEKQKPMKPIGDTAVNPFSYYCGSCKEELSDDGYYPSDNYCSNCGQMIAKR